ncbi:MAG TPA: DUF4278 domain-containing protein [Coleofasciculaceae cyanobacterium]|jgi:hypothetical protein
MRLSYRGVNYEDARATLEVTENEISSMYRGQNRPLRYLRHIPDPLQMQERRFRGSGGGTAQPSAPVDRVIPQPATISSHTWAISSKREVLGGLVRIEPNFCPLTCHAN